MATHKMKSAPYLKAQKNDGAELLVLIGSNAWQAWDKGNGTEWHLLTQALRTDEKENPVVIGSDQLADISRLQIAEKTERTDVRLFQCGNLSQSQLFALVANLAENSQVTRLTLCDSLGQLKEDLSDWLKRTREQGRESVAALLAKQGNKNAPMLDFESEKPTQPEIANAFLNWVENPIRTDSNTGKTFEYTGLYWAELPEIELKRKVREFYKAHEYNRYTANSLKSISDLIAIEAENLPTANADYLGFQNGVLNKKTGEFMPHKIDHYLRAIEKFNCNIHSKNTPHFDDWIEFVCNDNENKRSAILAGLYMVMTNRYEWGLFLEATGTAGAGKSVFSRIASIINGESNTAYLSLQELEKDEKRATLIGKSLAISPDQKPYTGSADELKAITGGDNVSVRLLYVGSFSTKLTPVFMLVTNNPLTFTDRNGGILRRRIIIPFDRAIPKEKKDVHFCEKVQAEVYGIVNKLLDLFPDPDTARKILENYRDSDEGQGIKREANHLIDFLGHFELKEHRNEHALRLGNARGGFVPYGDKTKPDSLYSAYLFYCECSGLNPINRFTFNNALSDAFKECGEQVNYDVKMYYGYETTNAFWKNRSLSIRQWEG